MTLTDEQYTLLADHLDKYAFAKLSKDMSKQWLLVVRAWLMLEYARSAALTVPLTADYLIISAAVNRMDNSTANKSVYKALLWDIVGPDLDGMRLDVTRATTKLNLQDDFGGMLALVGPQATTL